MPCITKADLSKPLDLKIERYPLPEWGKDAFVCVKALSSQQSVKMQHFANRAKTDDDISISYSFHQLAYCLVDEQGNQLFTDAKDVEENLDISLETVLDLVNFSGSISKSEKKTSQKKK